MWLKRWLGDRVMSRAPSVASELQTDDGRRFRVMDDRVFLRVLYEGVYEPGVTSLVRRLLGVGDIVVDVGANFGWYTTLFGKVVAPGRVFAYEPVPGTFEVLEQNVRLNGLDDVVELRCAAAGESRGSVRIAVREKESGRAHVVAGPGNAAAVDAPVLRLSDELRAHRGEVALVKIDVEGLELSVMRGAVELLDVDNPPILVLELNDEMLAEAGMNRGEVLSFLYDRSFALWRVSREGVLAKANERECDMAIAAGPGTYGDRVRRLARA